MFFHEFNLSRNHHLHYDGVYNSMPVMNGNYHMVDEYLAALNAVMASALNQYRKVFAFRFDLRLHEGVDASHDHFSNSVVSRFVDSLKAKIRYNRESAAKSGGSHGTKVRYFWVREVGASERVHYHFVVLLNGDAFNCLGSYQASSGNMANRIFEAWASAQGLANANAKPLVHFPENPSYILLRDDPKSIDAFFRRASYLCKAMTKQYGFGHHGYGASRN